MAEHKELLETEEKMSALRGEFRQVAREGGQFEGQIALLKKRLEDKETTVKNRAQWQLTASQPGVYLTI